MRHGGNVWPPPGMHSRRSAHIRLWKAYSPKSRAAGRQAATGHRTLLAQSGDVPGCGRRRARKAPPRQEHPGRPVPRPRSPSKAPHASRPCPGSRASPRQPRAPSDEGCGTASSCPPRPRPAPRSSMGSRPDPHTARDGLPAGSTRPLPIARQGNQPGPARQAGRQAAHTCYYQRQKPQSEPPREGYRHQPGRQLSPPPTGPPQVNVSYISRPSPGRTSASRRFEPRHRSNARLRTWEGTRACRWIQEKHALFSGSR